MTLWILILPWKQTNKNPQQVTQAVYERSYRKINGKIFIWKNKKLDLIILFLDLLYLAKVKFAYSWKGLNWDQRLKFLQQDKYICFISFAFSLHFWDLTTRISSSF